MAGRMNVQEDVTLASGSSCGGCNTDLGVNESWYADKSVAPEPVPESSENTAPEIAPPDPDQPALELPEVPKPPSKELKNGDVSPLLPDLKRAVPPKDDNGYNAPAKSIPSRSIAGPPLENKLDPSSITIAPESFAVLQQLSMERAPAVAPSHRRSMVKPVVPIETAQTTIEPANKKPTTLEDVQSDPQNVGVLNQPTKKIKATPISTSKDVSEPPVLEEASPESDRVNNGQSIEFRGESLPAKSFDTEVPAPIVLRAVPSDTHIVIDRRVADRRGSLGLPTTDTVAFQDLPALEEDGTSDHPVYFSTPDEPFEEPPADSRIPEIELPQYQSSPPMEPGPDGFTKPTSYQVPVENKASVLLNATSEVDGRMADQVSDNLEKNGTHTGAASQLIPHRCRAKILDIKSPVGQVRILRMRAATPMDRNRPPIVSIKSIMEPSIVRNVHPDASLPVADLETTVPGIQARPVFDQDRLEASIRGLSSRPKVEQTGSKTIDR